MKTILLILILIFSSLAFSEDVYVRGYYRSNGTYVQPYYRTAPDNTINNNYSTYGNVNPYTGKEGTVHPSNDTFYHGYGNDPNWGANQDDN